MLRCEWRARIGMAPRGECEMAWHASRAPQRAARALLRCAHQRRESLAKRHLWLARAHGIIGAAPLAREMALAARGIMKYAKTENVKWRSNESGKYQQRK